MPLAQIRGVNINYEVLGDTGPWVALSPGGRRGLEAVSGLARKIAAAGYRVLIHDRRNCGASDVVIDGDESEYQIWADDLHELLSQLDALPAYIGVMSRWREYFMQGADLPVIGASAADLKSITVPACIIPGNDKTHLREVGENLHRIMTESELHILFPGHVDVDLVPPEEWNTKEAEQAAIFLNFLQRMAAPVTA